MSHRRSQEDKRRLISLYNSTKNSYGAGAYYNEHKDRLIKYSYTGKGRGRYLKRRAARAVRRQPLTPDSPALRGAAYRRAFDYWWELF